MARALDDDADARSGASDAESDHEDHVMDPSDPRAHGREQLRARPNAGGVMKPPLSRWDSDADDGEEEEEEVDEDLGVPVQIDEDEQEKMAGDEEDKTAMQEKLKKRLSSWAAARFLVPRSERPLPVLEEPPLEPLNDFILSDFGSRFRGATGDVPVEKAVDESEDSDADGDRPVAVGAPLYDAPSASPLDKDDAKTTKDGSAATKDRKRRPESRYFITDLATKCFNCGQVGHMSAVCANDRVQKPCYYCALRGHSAFACPHLPCAACLQLGHEARDCPNKRATRGRSCALCGRAGHDKRQCDTASSMPATCMVCVDAGHLHCAPIPPPADRRLYCPHCAGNHTLAHCREYTEPAPLSFTARLPRSDMKCFMCNTAGHLAAECPKRTGYSGGNSCFNCGERGHYANDCPSKQPRGRKRGRNEFYADDDDEDDGRASGRGKKRNGGGGSHTRYVETYGEDDDDGDDDQYYYVPGGGGSSRGNGKSKMPRLDAALPSYRNSSNGGNNGNNGNGGGYKGGRSQHSSDRRRYR